MKPSTEAAALALALALSLAGCTVTSTTTTAPDGTRTETRERRPDRETLRGAAVLGAELVLGRRINATK